MSTHDLDQPLRVALLGCGTVGSQVARLVLDQHDDLTARIGAPLELVGIAVRDASQPRDQLSAELFTEDAAGLVARGDLDVVIELIGGIEPARSLIASALDNGASVVSANKALLAAHGQELADKADSAGVDLYYEAAVAGAIPILRTLRESLVGDEITQVMGIVNGTTNYILDQMTTTGADYFEALAEAQELGYAEADPTADVEGHDAAAKAAILASLAFHTHVSGDQVYVEGISQLTSEDIESARALGCVIKLLAVAQTTDDDQVEVRVHPVLLPESHPLAAISGAYNAVFVESREAEKLMFMGPGAGGPPTASAVMGDLVTVARNRRRGVAGSAPSGYTGRSVAPMGQTRCLYYLRFEVFDQPGVLASAASVFAQRGRSLQTVRQIVAPTTEPGQTTPVAMLGIMTHETSEQMIQECVGELEAADFVQGPVRLLRVEGMA